MAGGQMGSGRPVNARLRRDGLSSLARDGGMVPPLYLLFFDKLPLTAANIELICARPPTK